MKKNKWNFLKKGIYDDYVYDGFKKTLFISLFFIFLAGLVSFLINLYYSNLKIDNHLIDDRKIKVAFLFHLNQAQNPLTDVGNITSYKNLIKTLRAHPALKFNIHISGTLIQSLMWYDPTTISLIKEGVRSGQFEILGSTYAQNMMYSTDTTSNKMQIDRHKELIEKVFGVTPKGFWNAERTWKQSLTSLITDAGYNYTFIEDKAMRNSGIKGSEYFIRTTAKGKLFVVNDDHEFLAKFNNAIDAGDYETLAANRGAKLNENRKEYKVFFKYLRDIYKKDKNSDYLVNYADDAEMTGLIDFEQGADPACDFKNLDFLLSEIEKKKWIDVIRYSDVLDKSLIKEDITPIKDHAAIWIDKAAKGNGDYNEKGYKNWFDFNSRSPKLERYRNLYIKYYNIIKKYDTVNENNSVKNIVKLAKENYLSRQFEFGCTGISGTDEEFKLGDLYTMWENIRLISVYADIIESIKNKKDGIFEKDVDDDGINEIKVIYGDNYYIFSKVRGGRLLYWFDLKKGLELIGGEIGTNLSERYYDSNYPSDPEDYTDFIRFSNSDQDIIKYFEKVKYYVRTGGLNENITYKPGVSNKINELYKAKPIYSFKEHELTFKIEDFEKNIVFTDNGMEVNYKLPADTASLIINSEFEPDYYNIINTGVDAISISKNSNKFTFYNENSKIGISQFIFDGKFLKLKKSLYGYILPVEITKDTKLILNKISN